MQGLRELQYKRYQRVRYLQYELSSAARRKPECRTRPHLLFLRILIPKNKVMGSEVERSIMNPTGLAT
jgi:hypothetical protein